MIDFVFVKIIMILIVIIYQQVLNHHIKKKKIAETLPMQNASASTHEAGASQSSSMKVAQPETVVKQDFSTDSDGNTLRAGQQAYLAGTREPSLCLPGV